MARRLFPLILEKQVRVLIVISAMNTYNLIISTLKAEVKSGQIKSVQACRQRSETLCTEHDFTNNIGAISYDMGAA